MSWRRARLPWHVFLPELGITNWNAGALCCMRAVILGLGATRSLGIARCQLCLSTKHEWRDRQCARNALCGGAVPPRGCGANHRNLPIAPQKQNIPMYSLAGKLNNSASLHPPMLRTVNEKHSRVLNDAAAPTGATFDVLSRRRLGAQNIIKCWEKIAQEPCAFLHMGLIRNGVI